MIQKNEIDSPGPLASKWVFVFVFFFTRIIFFCISVLFSFRAAMFCHAVPVACVYWIRRGVTEQTMAITVRGEGMKSELIEYAFKQNGRSAQNENQVLGLDVAKSIRNAITREQVEQSCFFYTFIFCRL